MVNIKLGYFYRDGANYKNFAEVIFENPDGLALDEIENELQAKAIEDGGEFHFYVNEWHLKDLHCQQWDNEIDHLWHALEFIEETNEPANDTRSIRQFIEAVEEAGSSFWRGNR